jgi:hypothetical protein
MIIIIETEAALTGVSQRITFTKSLSAKHCASDDDTKQELWKIKQH